MTWLDRLSEAAYTSPSGIRMRFQYTDVSFDFEKRTAAFEFPGVNGTYVQDNGHSGRRYPLACYFSGADHDREAKAFVDLLSERGAGILDHPAYGRVNVVPFGQISDRKDLVSAANQTVLETVFWETLGAIYPSNQLSPKHEVTIAIGLTQKALAESFERSVDLGTKIKKANTSLSIMQALRNVQAALRFVSGVTESVNREFRNLQQQVNFGIDVLVGQPIFLASQILNLINAPARALAGIASRLEAYIDLLHRMIETSKSTPGDFSVLSRIQLRLSNDFHTSDLFASGAVVGSVASVLAHQFTAKPQCLEAAEAIIAMADALTAWRDGRFADLDQVDTGEGYQALQEMVALCVGYLVEISFTLVPERATVLDRPRNILELAAELYGSVDDRLDFLISTNKLTGSEIIELPRGKRIVWYAA
jgi:prophage DNA circulation protein